MEKKTIILLVDDEPLMLRLFGGKLNKAGFEVIYAHDGNEAREIARRLPLDIILMDLHMPVMDGMETLQRLKNEDITKHIPVIILTSEDLAMESEKIIIQDLKADDYIQKGMPLDEIVERIKKVLGKYADVSKQDNTEEK